MDAEADVETSEAQHRSQEAGAVPSPGAEPVPTTEDARGGTASTHRSIPNAFS